MQQGRVWSCDQCRFKVDSEDRAANRVEPVRRLALLELTLEQGKKVHEDRLEPKNVRFEFQGLTLLLWHHEIVEKLGERRKNDVVFRRAAEGVSCRVERVVADVILRLDQ